ncbi:DUF1831 domain-containing protein [Fructobacillus sp. M2-14]|uniref:DUF1831 domain-containing protein n=1 Tax=Fructobacillus broussonetiae TaxID=2713173 RepID=A0ABS5QZ71_9LACO|nr:cysteine desulfurase [Fructobacillus broussonetiae]MBS9338481.1 DUF1831 domain-containing protein [Fructobacillus broussonetiae]
MAFSSTFTIKNVGTYSISPSIKKFTLIDLGFTQNNAGAFILKRFLQPDKLIDQAISLKITFKQDLSGAKADIVGMAGGPVSIGKQDDASQMEEILAFHLKELVERNVLEQTV